jgi:transcriptional regulator with XRE-family HTH domain
MELAARLSKAIVDSGKSMKEIARELGVSPGHLSDLKNGKKRPRPTTIRKIADYFEFDVAELVMGEFQAVSTRPATEVPAIAKQAADALARMVAQVNELAGQADRLREDVTRLRHERDSLREEIATLRARRQVED